MRHSRSICNRVAAFLFVIQLGFSLGVAPCGEAAPKQNRRRPNILFCLADDWSWPHAGMYGDRVVNTPTFDRVAREGVLFTHAFCAAPSCTPSRGAILTGQAPHRLEEGGNLWSFLPKKFPVYSDLLDQSGYVVGHTRKGWGPGNFQAGGRARNPAGPQFQSFAAFLKKVPREEPFCFWFGSHDPHRPYDKGSGLASGMKLDGVVVPPYLPDTPEVRSDILDYYFEVQRFDREVGEILQLLSDAGKLDDTLIVISGDNGWPFPRAKTNLHDSGTRQPLAVRWARQFKGGRIVDDLVSLTDLAPTFLDAAGIKPLAEMTGKSLLPLLLGERQEGREMVFLERERHANVRRGNLGYPARAVRTKDFLYLRNFRPDRWPGGDPEQYISVGPFGDCDNSPTKDLVLARRNDEAFKNFFDLSFSKRPAEELYDLSNDPFQLVNVADRAQFTREKGRLRDALDRWMKETNDPRAFHDDDRWDKYPYFGPEARRDVAK